MAKAKKVTQKKELTWIQCKPAYRRMGNITDLIVSFYEENSAGKIRQKMKVTLPANITSKMGWTPEDKYLLLMAKESNVDFCVVRSPNGYKVSSSTQAGNITLRFGFESSSLAFFENLICDYDAKKDQVHFWLPE